MRSKLPLSPYILVHLDGLIDMDIVKLNHEFDYCCDDFLVRIHENELQALAPISIIIMVAVITGRCLLEAMGEFFFI